MNFIQKERKIKQTNQSSKTPSATADGKVFTYESSPVVTFSGQVSLHTSL